MDAIEKLLPREIWIEHQKCRHQLSSFFNFLLHFL